MSSQQYNMINESTSNGNNRGNYVPPTTGAIAQPLKVKKSDTYSLRNDSLQLALHTGTKSAGVSNQYVSPHQQQSLVNGQAQQPVLTNNITLNINGTTNINNFHHGSQAPMSVGQPPQQKLKKNKPEDALQHVLQVSRQNNQQVSSSMSNNKNGTTLISKKILNQAKQSRVTPPMAGSCVQKKVNAKSLLKKQAKIHQLQEAAKQQQLNLEQQPYQPGMGYNKNTNTLFDFNFDNKLGSSTGNDAINGTMPVTPGEILQIKNNTLAAAASVRQQKHKKQASQYTFNSTQVVNLGSKRNTQKVVKTSRIQNAGGNKPVNQTNLRPKRYRSEVRRVTSRPLTTANALIRQAGNPKSTVNKTMTSEQNKENLNMFNLSRVDRNTTQKITKNNIALSISQQSRSRMPPPTNKSQHVRNTYGLTLSSFSSTSNRGNRIGSQNRDGANSLDEQFQDRMQASNPQSIAQQLSKNYFLNSKQLLRHLSPVRFDSKIDKTQIINSIGGLEQTPHIVPNSLCEQMTSSRNQQNRGRTRSTAAHRNNHSGSGATAPRPVRKNHSHSQSKSNKKNQLQITKNPHYLQSIMVKAQISGRPKAQQLNLDMTQPFAKSNSVNYNYQAQLPPSGVTPNHNGQKPNGRAVDKLIKQNLRKKKYQLEEEAIKKQLEEFRQKQRRADLSQRDQQIRKQNASKIINANPRQNQLHQHSQVNQSKEMQLWRRSQSCIEQPKNNKSTSDDQKRAHHSQGRNANDNQTGQDQQLPQQKDLIKQRPIPNTTTNRTNGYQRGNKPRSFVDEINQLTHLVEQEIGGDHKNGPSHQVQQNVPQKLIQTNLDIPNSSMVSPALTNPSIQLAFSTQGGQVVIQMKKHKRDRSSHDIQKFIERKKRQEYVKKSLEHTIEVDKSLKIQQNLVNLERFVKKHMRQKSQLAISTKKQQNLGGTLNKTTRRHKKDKNKNDTLLGLPEVFSDQYLDDGNTPVNSFIFQEDIRENNGTVKPTISHNSSQRNERGSQNDYNTNYIKVTKKPYSTSGSNVKKIQSQASGKHGKAKSGIPLDRSTLSTGGTRNGTGTTGQPRKSSAREIQGIVPLKQNGKEQQDISMQLRPIFQMNSDQIPKQYGNQPEFRERYQQQPHSASEPYRQIQPDKSMRLAGRHPNAADQQNQYQASGGNRIEYYRPPNTNFKEVESKLEADSPHNKITNLNEIIQYPQQQQNQYQRAQKRFNQAATVHDYSNSQQDVSRTMINTSNPGYINHIDSSSIRLTPKSAEHIRRVHELVALYRCRFKPNLSDASVMGTLHSAASVIQVHFRYLRHREQAKANQSNDDDLYVLDTVERKSDYEPEAHEGDSSGFIDSADSRQHLEMESVRQEASDISSNEYIDTTEKKKKSSKLDRSGNPQNRISKESKSKSTVSHIQGHPEENTGNRQQMVDTMTPVEWQLNPNDENNYYQIFGDNTEGQLSSKRGLQESSQDDSDQRKEVRRSIISVVSSDQQKRKNNHSSMVNSVVTSPPHQIVSQKSINPILNDYDENASALNRKLSQMNRSISSQSGKGLDSKHHYQRAQNFLPQLTVEDEDEEQQDGGNINSQLANKGQKTPQVPGLDLNRLHSNSASGNNKDRKMKEQAQQPKLEYKDSNGADEQPKAPERAPFGQHGESPKSGIQDSPTSQGGDQQRTVSSYSSIFNKMGLPLPRSARVQVVYDLVQKDPKISEQLRDIVRQKDVKGRKILEEGRFDNLITERTYEVNKQKLEKWVNASYTKIDQNEKMQRSGRKQKISTQDELMQDAEEGRQRLQKIISITEGDRMSAHSTNGRPSARQSARQYGLTSQSYRAMLASPGAPAQGAKELKQTGYNSGVKAANYTDRDPYGGNVMGGGHEVNVMSLGSGRQEKSKLVSLIRDSSRTSSNHKKQSGSDSRKNPAESSSYGGQHEGIQEDGALAKLDDIQIRFDEAQQPRENAKFLSAYQDATSEAENNDYGNVSQSECSEKGRLGHYGELEMTNQATDKSLDKSQSYPAMMDPEQAEKLNELSGEDEEAFQNFKNVQAVLQLEDALLNEQRKQLVPKQTGDKPAQHSQESEKTLVSSPPTKKLIESQQRAASNASITSIEDIRDPQFFSRIADEQRISQRSEESNNVQEELSVNFQDLKNNKPAYTTTITKAEKPNPFNNKNRRANYSGMQESMVQGLTETVEDESQLLMNDEGEESSGIDNFPNDDANANYEQFESTNLEAKKSTQERLIKVENQQNEEELSVQQPSTSPSQAKFLDQILQKGELSRSQIQVNPIMDNQQIQGNHPVSPVSDSPAYEFKIQTGAHSLSSTDSDMTKVIHAANKDGGLDSPPDLISPKAGNNVLIGSLLESVQDLDSLNHEQMTDQITDLMLAQLVEDLKSDIEIMVPRTNAVAQRQMPAIKFFDRRGIRTDIFAIERYVDEVLEEVKTNQQAFMAELNRPLSKDAMDILFQMRNSEIGSYEHFLSNLPPVLPLEGVYLKLEKRRKESLENSQLDGQRNQHGQFDFENVNEEELREDGVDRNFLVECQYIHNKVLFDSINDSLQQFRPHGREGQPMGWSKQARKVLPKQDQTIEEIFEMTKHDLFRMAIMAAGVLPRREFVLYGQFDEELFAELREKKLARLLCREIVDTEPQWLKWDFEEAQTKIAMADIVLDTLVQETVEFLLKKEKETNSAQAQFEELEQLIKSKY